MKRIVLVLLTSVFISGLLAQTVIPTPFTNTNGQAGITFNLQNNNATVGRLLDLSSAHFNNGGPVTVTLWFKASAINGAPGAISTANGWTQIATNTVTSSTTISSLFPNLCFPIPANTTYGFFLGTTGTIGYQTLAAGTYTFSGAGFSLITGTNIGYGGPATGPAFTPRGFIGSVTVSNTSFTNDVAITDITSPSACYGPNTPVTVKITNLGTATQTSIPVAARVTFPNLSITNLTGTYTGSLAACASDVFTFSPTINTSPNGNYLIRANTQLAGDQRLSNDTFFATKTNNSLAFPYNENFNAGIAPAGYTGNMEFGPDIWFGEEHGTNNTGGMHFNLYAFDPNFLEELPSFAALPPNAIFKYDYRIVDWSGYNNAAPTPTSNLNANDAFNLQISTNCGATWTTIRSINTGNHTVGNTFTTVSVNLAAYAGQAVRFRFEGIWGTGGTADYFVDIDNINIESKIINFSPTALVSPVNNGCHNDTLKIVLKNKGGMADDSIAVTANITGAINTTFNALYTASIAPLDSVILPLGVINLPAGGVINIRTITSQNKDSIFVDDTLSVNNITIRPLPVVSILNDTVCITDTATIAASGGSSYNWGAFGNTGTIKVYTLVPKFYPVTVSDAFGCKTIDSASVGVNLNPTITISTADSFICQLKSATLAASGGVSYVWSNGQITNPAIYTPSVTTLAKVIGTDANGCKDSATQLITLFPAPNPVAFGDTVCKGTFGNLSASGGLYYDWGVLGATKKVQAKPAVTTVYTVTVSDAIGCSATASATIVVKDLPVAVVTNDSFCNGKSATLQALGGVSYNWGIYGTNSSIVVSPTKTTRYPVLVKGPNGCEKLEYVWAIMREKPAITPYPDTICKGDVATISAAGGITYNWGSLGNTPTVQVNNVVTSTAIPLTITDVYSCTNTGTVDIIVRNIPALFVDNPTICDGGTATIKANTFIPNSTYSWSGSGNGQTISVKPTATTDYSVTATDPFGCSVSGKSTVTVKAKPVVKFNTTVPASVCDDVRSINLEAQPNGGIFSGKNVSFATFYPKVSQIGDFTVYYNYDEPGNAGCSGTDSLVINVKSCKVTTAINSISGVSEVSTYPNPFNNQISIEINAGEPAKIQLSIMDMTGKLIVAKELTLSNGLNTTSFETINMSAGSYMIRITKDNEFISIPVVKQ
jgi:hypothetical protein